MIAIMRKFKFPILKTLCVFLIIAFGAVNAYAQTIASGKVTDNSGAGVAGITVTVKGTTNATSTNTEGNFSINIPAGAKTLVFSGIGFTTQEVPVGGQASYDVTLQNSTSSLNEVVVIGYGTVKKKDLTGASTTVSSRDFQKGAVATPEQLILGKVAGVNITSNGGAPGAGSTIRIRGGSSLAASNDPLIIIDGVQLSGGGIAGSANALALINPNDIETFTILKDASAAAIYGSRASNGVIIITTKKGKAGKARINFNSNLSVGVLSKKIDVLSADEFRTFVRANGTPEQIALLGVASTDWQDEIYQRALGTDNNISVSGTTKGNFKMPYRVSAGYLNQEGILKTGELKRFSGAVNLSPSFLDDHLKVELNVKGTNTQSQFADEGAIGSAVNFDPTKPVRTGAARFGGYFEWLDANATNGLKALAPNNPIGLLNGRDNNSNVNRSIGNIQVDYKFHFLPALRVNVNVGYDIAKGTGNVILDDSIRGGYQRNVDENGVRKGGQKNIYKQEIQNTFLETYLNYTKDVASIKSRFDLTGGYGYYENLSTNFSYADFFRDGTKVLNSDPQFDFDKPMNRLISFYGRFNYTFNGKYLLTAAARTDGSSRLNPDDRWITYYSGALAWRISEEAFLKNSKTISDLKLRGGYGITGQQDGIGNYDFYPRYGISNQTAQYQLGSDFINMYRPVAYNPNLKWEQTATTNIALDYGLFNNRITGSVDFYLKETKDLLNQINQSAGTNFAPVSIANVGNMENKGVEFSMNSSIVRKKDFSVDFGYNVTFNRNRITKLTFTEDPNYEGQRFGGRSGGTGGTILINSVGYNRGAFYVYKQVYDNAGKPIDNLFEDINRDGVISEKDLYRYKSANPDVFLGFNGNIAYKRFNAGFIARASLGNYMYNNVASATGATRNILNPLVYLSNGSSDVLNTGFKGEGDKYYSSDYYVQNASFFRLDNVNLGYNFGKVFNDKADMRFNFNVQNVLVITKYTGADPENAGGIDNNFYPRPRTFVAGINLDF
jgi:TonB-dependent starch-binding outer membrane protein SusC